MVIEMTGVKDGNVRKDTIVAKDVNVPNVVNHGLKEQKTIRKPVVRNNGYEVIYRPEPVSVPGFFIGVCRGGIAPVLRFPAK